MIHRSYIFPAVGIWKIQEDYGREFKDFGFAVSISLSCFVIYGLDADSFFSEAYNSLETEIIDDPNLDHSEILSCYLEDMYSMFLENGLYNIISNERIRTDILEGYISDEITSSFMNGCTLLVDL